MKPFKILSIDGGGIRGVYSAHVLSRIEDRLATNLLSAFDMFAGTSAGAIIAAGIACGKKPEELKQLYMQLGSDVFKGPRWHKRGMFASRYSNSRLKSVLSEFFGDVKMGDVSVPLIIPTTDIGNSCVHVIKSAYSDGFVRDKAVKVCDAVLASCSAPTYFDPIVIGEYFLADGGLWANSPSLVAVLDAKRLLGIELESMRVLSIGTGSGGSYYSIRRRLLDSIQGWGMLTRWKRERFISMLLNLQAQTACNMTELLLDQEQVLRIDFHKDRPLALDDASDIADYISWADHDFTHNSRNITCFLNSSNGGQYVDPSTA